ncbi:MAG: hypothetical protein QXO03_00360 [Thermoplasmatales archaeon]
MTGTRTNFPKAEGRIYFTFDRKKFEVKISERSFEITGKASDISSFVTGLPLSIKSLKSASKIAKVLSNFDVKVTVNDEKGPLFKIGKGVWSPLGKIYISPRARKLRSQR